MCCEFLLLLLVVHYLLCFCLGGISEIHAFVMHLFYGTTCTHPPCRRTWSDTHSLPCGGATLLTPIYSTGCVSTFSPRQTQGPFPSSTEAISRSTLGMGWTLLSRSLPKVTGRPTGNCHADTHQRAVIRRRAPQLLDFMRTQLRAQSYVYIYIYIYICTCMYVYIYIYIYIYTYT